MLLRDRNTLDLTEQCLQIAEDVLFWPVRERGELVYRIEIPKLHRFFRVGYEEYVLISLLDGTRTIPQACGLAAAKLGSRAPTTAQAGTIARWLMRNKLAHLAGEEPPNRRIPNDGRANRPSAGKLIGKLNPFWIKLPMPLADRLMNAAAKWLSPVFAPPSVMICGAVLLIASCVLVAHWDEFVSSSTAIFHPGNWVWLLATWVILKLIHELAHAIACSRQGGTVRESGIVLILFAPLAYVDVTNCWRMNSRWSRIAVASAGMFVEVVLGAVAVLTWASIDAPVARHLLYNIAFTAGLSTLLFNANALMRFDGYFILADLIEVPNLYSEASTAVRRIAIRILTGVAPPPGNLNGWRRHFVLAYGVAAMAWRVMICLTLAIAASTMFAGAGLVIAVTGIAFWIGRPLQKLHQFFVDLKGQDPSRFLRAAAVCLLGLCIGSWICFGVPLPTSIRAPAIVRYLPETIVRSRVSGFVSRIHVREGQRVQKGDLILELENRDLENRRQQLEITQRQNEIRLRRATDQHDAGQQLVIDQNQQAISEQLDHLRRQSAGLKVTAPRDGRVIVRGLASRIGTYVTEGESLFVVAAESDKEMVAVIGQDVIDDVRLHVGTDLIVRLANFQPTIGRLSRIEPRASDQLQDPALAASEGGSLAVQATVDESAPVRLVEPHFRGRIDLQPSVAAEIPAGMRTTTSLGYRSESVAIRLRTSIRRLWHAAHKQAGAQ